MRERLEELRKSPVKLRKKPILDGHEIIKILGLERGGPAVASAIDFLKDQEDELANDGKELTPSEARRLLKEEFKLP